MLGSAKRTISPPLPPSPPLGPPLGSNFSRRKETWPPPPEPAKTLITASSMNMEKGRERVGVWGHGWMGHDARPPRLPRQVLQNVRNSGRFRERRHIRGEPL